MPQIRVLRMVKENYGFLIKIKNKNYNYKQILYTVLVKHIAQKQGYQLKLTYKN